MEFRQALYVLKIVILVFLITFSVDKALYFSFNKISDEVFTGQGIGKLNHFLKIKNELDLVVLGSSRANHSIDPTKISDKSFNMGVDATKLAYASALIKTLPPKKEQTILLQIDPDNAFDQNYQGKDILRLKSKYERIETIKREIQIIGQNNWFQDIFWSLGYNNTVLAILKNTFRPNYDYKNYSGYDPLKVTETQRLIFENTLEQDSTKLFDIDCPQAEKLNLNSIYERSLEEISKFCLENKKHLIVFTAPIYDDVCKEDNKKLKEVLSIKGINYHDFSDYFVDENSFDYWKDKTHLSNAGAELFTESIFELIETMDKDFWVK